jgi:HK97 family phage portal protein
MSTSVASITLPSGETRASIENPSVSLTDSAAMMELLGVQPSAAGVHVSPDSAMRFGAVYTCVNIIGQTIGTLPLQVYRRTEKGKALAPTHPTYRILHASPNAQLTAAVYLELIIAHLLLWGNHYSWIRWTQAGRLFDLQPLMPWQVTPRKNSDGTVRYEVVSAAGMQVLSPDEVLHIPALGWDGLRGLSPISMLRNAIGLGMAAEDFGARFFANDARPGVIVESVAGPGNGRAEQIKSEMQDKFSGPNRWKVMVLGPGLKLHPVTMPMDDAQFLETRKFQKTEIFGIYRVPPHLAGDLDKATFSNIEQQDIGFAKHCIRPLCVRIEMELTRKLYGMGAEFFAEFNLDGLLRGDFKSRMEGYQIAAGGPFVTRNEVRELENWQPMAGGERLLMPVNMAPVGDDGLPMQVKKEEPGDEPAQPEAAD